MNFYSNYLYYINFKIEARMYNYSKNYFKNRKNLQRNFIYIKKHKKFRRFLNEAAFSIDEKRKKIYTMPRKKTKKE